MTILVTGGAGYIGAHVVRLLQERGEKVVVVDDLSTGRADRVGDAELVQIDVAAPEAVDVLTRALTEHDVRAVIHFAARKQVGESVEKPAWYYQQNVGGFTNLVAAMQAAGNPEVDALFDQWVRPLQARPLPASEPVTTTLSSGDVEATE